MRHSAEFYGNEAEVGKAIKASGISREELFLCSKVWTTTIEKGECAIRAQLDKSELRKEGVFIFCAFSSPSPSSILTWATTSAPSGL